MSILKFDEFAICGIMSCLSRWRKILFSLTMMYLTEQTKFLKLLPHVLLPCTPLRICTDCQQLSSQGVHTAGKAVRLLKELVQDGDQTWLDLKKELKANDVCVKPIGDGCSTGVARLRLVLLCYLPWKLCNQMCAWSITCMEGFVLEKIFNAILGHG